jgi:hypothetical protein
MADYESQYAQTQQDRSRWNDQIKSWLDSRGPHYQQVSDDLYKNAYDQTRAGQYDALRKNAIAMASSGQRYGSLDMSKRAQISQVGQESLGRARVGADAQAAMMQQADMDRAQQLRMQAYGVGNPTQFVGQDVAMTRMAQQQQAQWYDMWKGEQRSAFDALDREAAQRMGGYVQMFGSGASSLAKIYGSQS